MLWNNTACLQPFRRKLQWPGQQLHCQCLNHPSPRDCGKGLMSPPISIHAYNATWSAVTRYSPHYLMFGWWPRLLVDCVLPTIGSNEAPTREASARSVDMYIASVRDRLRSALQKAQAQSTAEACWQKHYYDRRMGTVNLKPGNLVLVKVDAWKGKRKIKDRWEEETWEVVWQIMADVPSYKVMNQYGQSQVLHQNWLLLITSKVGIHLCMGNHHTWERCTSPTPCKTTFHRRWW